MTQLKRRWRLIGRRSAKRTGRHTTGHPYVRVEHRHPDPRARATAVLLDRLEPAWMILYGPWSRRFYALALFATPGPLIVEAFTAQELTDQMRQAEQDTLIAPWPPTAAAPAA
ncbi:hypothetical protein AB0O34_06760 [Sphaerisporangium sp. NPDC088356]|uniref:hypothetical protein n=1 Tax=Sphaerisporangium sp. NPDC088356 TaxID=3154871 RepID=UPI0034369845